MAEVFVARPTRTTITLHCTTRAWRTSVQLNATTKKKLIVSAPHHRQGAHPSSSSKVHEILFTKTIMHVKTTRIHVELRMAYYVSVHSSSSHPSLSYSFVLKLSLFLAFASAVTLQDLHTPPHMPGAVQSIGTCF